MHADDFTGTQPVAPHLAFDVNALCCHLQAHLPGFAGPVTLEQFRGGQSNPTYKLGTPQRTYVLRAKPAPAARLLPSAHAIEREFRVMQALAGTGVPVAGMHLLCTDESVIGRAFYVMDFVPGRVLWDPALPGMDAGSRAALYDEMNRVLAALHRVAPESAGLADFGRSGNYFERQIGRWSRQYDVTLTQPIDAMARLMAWLPAHIPPGARDDAQQAVVHGDFRIDNLVFAAGAPRIAAVLDWELSTLGHPLADLNNHCLAWHIPAGLFRGLGGHDLAALGIPPVQDYVRRYCERTGRNDAATVMRDWNFYLAYNLFRLAAIAQGIAYRVEDGTATSARARENAALARPLAELAWQFAQGR